MARSTHQGPGLELLRPAQHSPAPFRPEQLLRTVRERIRAKGMSPRTQDAYILWIKRFLRFHGDRHPTSLRVADLERFVTHLVVQEGLSVQSQNQAAAAVVFLYRELFGRDFGGRHRISRAKQPKMLPKYATPAEAARVFAQLRGVSRIAAMIMYGSGTRIAETMALRVKDVSLQTRELYVRGGKGAKDRTTLIAQAAVPLLREQIQKVEQLHARDRERGDGWAQLPAALHRKDPHAGWDLAWQYLFPASHITLDPKTRRTGRRHLHPTVVQRALKRAAREAKVARPISAHVLRHCFATELLRSGCDIRLLQRLMGHKDLKTTALYLHILDRPGVGLVSPLDRLAAAGFPPTEAVDEQTGESPVMGPTAAQ